MKNIVSADEQRDELVDTGLRPLNLDSFIGQDKIKNNLSVFIKAAKDKERALDHVLLYGPPGLGKTSIAQIIAREMGVQFKATSGPLLSKAADLAAIVTNVQHGDVLFIDEIHRLNAAVEEVLYPVMEDFRLDLIIGEGPSARSVNIEIQKFTLIGATTRMGLLTKPLRERFGIPLRLSFYSISELQLILANGAKKLHIHIDSDATKEIAMRARGTPRIALRLLKRIVDFAHCDSASVINFKTATYALERLEVDRYGLDSNDYRYLQFIADKYNGGPVGVETISAGLSEHKDSIEEAIEPYLIQRGFINRTPRGRVLTELATNYLAENNKDAG